MPQRGEMFDGGSAKLFGVRKNGVVARGCLAADHDGHAPLGQRIEEFGTARPPHEHAIHRP